jgi:uncharacterized BrkB/YihY/UPF0761 family membrane protein
VNIAAPGSAFGAAGSVLILLWFLSLTSAIVVTGAEINAVLARRNDGRLDRDPEEVRPNPSVAEGTSG